MPFVNEIIKYKSLSIVGLEKNTGKTECLNYILNRLPLSKLKIAVTSIGIDGEAKDRVTNTKKPEIFLKEGMFFSTDEVSYRDKRLISEVVDITQERGALGRIITAKVLFGGKVQLSGPSSVVSLKRWKEELKKHKINLSIVDGAISRLSPASPVISEAMILSTGAAYSLNTNILVNRTKYIVDLIKLPKLKEELSFKLNLIDVGIWGIREDNSVVDLKINSSLILNTISKDVFKGLKMIYLSGALTDKFLGLVREENLEIVVRDFTKIFLTEIEYRKYLNKGGKIWVLNKSNLLAVCINPTSPQGYIINSDILRSQLQSKIDVPVYDIFREKNDF